MDGSTTELDVSWPSVRWTRHYRIEWRAEGQESGWTTTTKTSHRIGGLAPGTTYTVKVTPVRSSWRPSITGEAQGTTNGTPPEPPPPADSESLPAPTGLVATPGFVDDGRMTIGLLWNPVPSADFYRVRLTDGSGGEYETRLSHGSAMKIYEPAASILRPATTYTVEVSAHRREADPNAGVNKATAQVTTLSRPTGLAVTPVAGDAGALDVSWDPFSGATGYCLDWRTPPGIGSYGTTQSLTSQTTTYQISGLVASTEYEVRLGFQKSGSGCTDNPAAKARGTTSELTVQRVGGVTAENHPLHVTELRLNWQAVPGTTAYRVEYKAGTDPSEPFVLFRDSTPPLQVGHFFRLMGLEADTEYTVQVTALGSGGSLGSGQAVGTTRAVFDGVQASPVVNHGDGLIVSWPALEPSTGYYHYTVRYRKDGTASWVTAKAGAASPFRITGLTPNANYAVRVAVAWYIRGNTLGGDAGEDTVIATTSELAIGGVEARTDHTNQNQLRVFWEDDSRADHYRVEYKKGSIGLYHIPYTVSQTISRANLTIGIPSFKATATVTGLEADTLYTVQVVAIEGATDGLEMGSGRATGKTRGPFGPVTVQPIQGEADKLDVWWTAIPRDDISYVVEYRTWLTPDGTGPNTGAFTAVTRTDPKAAYERITGLEEDTIYTVRVTARHQNNDIGQASGSGTPGTATESTPTKPLPTTLTLAVEPVTGENTQLAASWNGVEGATKYSVSWKESGVGNPWSEAVETTGTSYTITGLKAGTNYVVYVAATGADGYLKADDSHDATTTGGTLTGLSVSAPATNAHTRLVVSWTWTPPAGITTRYNVRWKTATGNYSISGPGDEGRVEPPSRPPNLTRSPHTITGLTADTAYTIHVFAYNTATDEILAAGAVVGTTAAPPQTGEAVQPDPSQDQDPVGTATLTGLTVASVSGQPTQLAVSWGAVQGAARYDVRWKTGAGDYGDAQQATTNSYTITGLSANTSYTVNVAALDGDNTLLAEATANGATEPQTGQSTDPNEGEGTDEQQSAAAPDVSFVIYYDPDAGDAAVDRYNQAVKLLKDAGISYSEVIGDVQEDVDGLAGVTGSVLPRFFLGDPTEEGWTSKPRENNGGLRWLKEKVAELSGG